MTPTVPPRLWIANLDAELHWSPKQAPRTLPKASRQRLAAVGSLFRFLARRGDALWLPAPVDPRRLPPGGGEIEIVTGPPETTLRRFAGHELRPWADAPPWIEGERAEIAGRVNDRRFALELAQKLGVSDERIGVARSVETMLERARAHGLERWVVKAPFSSSGRERHLHLGGSVNEAPIEKLLRRHGELVFEPWHERTLDVGVLFECPPGAEPRAHHPRAHYQLMSPAGAVKAIELDGPVPEELIKLAGRVAEELTAAGYRGPAGIDAWQHREEGEDRWHLLGEINARWSVGHLARQVVRKLNGGASRLEIGDRPAFEAARENAESFHALLLPSESNAGIWLAASQDCPGTAGVSPA